MFIMKVLILFDINFRLFEGIKANTDPAVHCGVHIFQHLNVSCCGLFCLKFKILFPSNCIRACDRIRSVSRLVE